VHLELVGLDESALGEPVADLGALVALQLQHLAVLRVLHHCAVASELLRAKGKMGASMSAADDSLSAFPVTFIPIKKTKIASKGQI